MTAADSMLADVILATSPIVRLGLAAPSERVRERAAHELAHVILVSLEGEQRVEDRRQMPLPL